MCRLILLLFLIYFNSTAQVDFEWQEGDILFQDGNCGDFCEAIRKVTNGYEGENFTHNGLLMMENDQWYVLEAIGQGVSQTLLSEFLERYVDEKGSPKVMLGRLKDDYRYLIPDAILEAKTKIGKPYDHEFDFENDAYYCSELIHFAFKKANDGVDVFEPQPMTYVDPETGMLFSIWEEYFGTLGIEVPEGKPGLNPGGMSLSPILRMHKLY
ncbi:YiiX/YebB-like N1pC/P60 family cysteine hydrolase [Arthrospiribacter ruber]|uniref:Permuted papain-like amidase enzyme, YaeF/YiiX, C92 family n=1 Tax=Arthrospiribacter ruber TaxID=2487934 RepID=A0A951IYR7_9BACT|nr:YiiX/YebB-like N1pC/P60 family cysteine hydrolase [Arthrospiribacter ruber]MBW3468719.1 hypothetical protein [Arthrospiribacter ruber]